MKKWLLDFSILRRNRNFRWLFLGQFISFFGTMITGVALPYQIYHLTNSVLMVGLLSLAQLIPLIFTALIGGAIADRYARRRLIMYAEFLLSIGCLLLLLNAHSAHPQVFLLFIISASMSAITGLHRPAMTGLTQQMIAREDFTASGALSSFMYSGCAIIGPAIAGLIIAHFSLFTAYLVDFISFVISFGTIFLIENMPKPVVEHTENIWRALLGGLRFAGARQELLGSYFVDFIAMVFGMPNALFPAIAQSFGGVQTLGLLYSAPAVGSLLATLFTGWCKHVKRHGLAIAWCASLWGVAIIAFGLSKHLWLALLFLAFAGGFDALSGVFRVTLWNENIPTEFRGRLAGIEMISYLSGPKLGDTESGLVAAAFGISFSIISGGFLCIVGVVICCLILPKFTRYRSVEIKQDAN